MDDAKPHVHQFDFVFKTEKWRCACGQTMAAELMPEPPSLVSESDVSGPVKG